MSKLSHEIYDNPLVSRYASAQMLKVFSPQFKFGWWRRLWLALAESQKELGLPIKANQLAQTILIFADNTGFGWRSIFSVCCKKGGQIFEIDNLITCSLIRLNCLFSLRLDFNFALRRARLWLTVL